MSNAIVQVGPSEKTDSGRVIVHAALGGTLGPEDIQLLKSWGEGLNATVKKFADEQKSPVAVLIDISSFEMYTNPDVITLLWHLMKEDNAYIYRTATFGGTVVHEMIEQVIRSLAGRTNLKNFKSEAEARTWLTQ